MVRSGQPIFFMHGGRSIALNTGQTLLIGQPRLFEFEFRQAITENRKFQTEIILRDIDWLSLNGLRQCYDLLKEVDGYSGLCLTPNLITDRILRLVRGGQLLALVLPPVSRVDAIGDIKKLETISKSLTGSNDVNVEISVEESSFQDLTSSSDRIVYALKRSPQLIENEIVQRSLSESLTPMAVASVTVVMGAWAKTHTTEAGFAVDDTLIAIGYLMLGWNIFGAMKRLIKSLEMTKAANSLTQLDEAAGLLGEAITMLGVETFIALLNREAGRHKRVGSNNSQGRSVSNSSAKSNAETDAQNKEKIRAENEAKANAAKEQPEAAVAKPVDEIKSCCLTALTAKCGHSKRNFILKPPSTKTNDNNDQLIQILADNENAKDGDLYTDKIKINLEASTPCPKGGIPKINFDGQSYAQKSLELDLEGPSDEVIGPKMDFVPFLRTFLLVQPGKKSKLYSGGASCVEGASELDFQVEVFPKRKWSGEISVGYEFSGKEKIVSYSVLDKNNKVTEVKQVRSYDVDTKGYLKVEGKLEGNFAGKKTSFEFPSYKSKSSSQTADTAFSKLNSFFENILPRLNLIFSSPLVEIRPQWPKITFGGSCENFEVPDKYNVDRKGTIELGFNPLLGMEGKADILDWLIVGGASMLGMPTVGLKLAKLKGKAEKGYRGKYFSAAAKASIDITVGGKVSGGLKWDIIPEEWDEVSGSVRTDLDFEIKGEISGEVRVLIVSYRAGAYLKGSTGVAGELTGKFYGEELGFDGKLIFKGIIIEAVVYSGFDGKKSETNIETANERGDRGRKKRGAGKAKDIDFDKAPPFKEEDKVWRIELVPKAEWPSSDKTVITQEDSL